MADIRRVIVIFVIAVLFTIFVNVSIEAIHPSPKYQDYCKDYYEENPYINSPENQDCKAVNTPSELTNSCEELNGRISYERDDYGCAVEAYCETCHVDFEKEQEKYNLVVFIVSSITGLIALFVGLNLPAKKNLINEWVGSGFLLGGLITIFTGTFRYFGDMARFIKPLVIPLEIVLVIYLAYEKLGKKAKN